MCGPSHQKTVTMIADGRNNSLAASLEILTYLGNIGVEGKILHGTNDEIVSAVVETVCTPTLQGRIGLFGQPSDWLIASGVDRDYLRQHYGIETIDIDLQRLIDGIKTIPQIEAEKSGASHGETCQSRQGAHQCRFAGSRQSLSGHQVHLP
jgi:hypothetical protein